MNASKIIPRWIIIIGQSGGGKGTVAGILGDELKLLGKSVLEVSTGEEIRKCIGRGTHTGLKMKKENELANRQPAIIAAQMWLSKIMTDFTGNEIIIHEGSPRSVPELEIILSLKEAGYYTPVCILEVIADANECAVRLAERTKLDKRTDLSMAGEPGVPDPDKIKNKISWWTNARDGIIKRCKKEKCYLSIKNNGSLDELIVKVKKLFF